ncbi:hypothetical protein [Actinomadura fibrosa]|uniref:Nuclear transport factor 2 family protein n=1 Tax=Actinomadura fibrosa TaxID=111802 RepID=A0ABW2XFV3_9ACTN|nr:hypothetical protein [Actinomadura fibrosa]
MQVRPSCRTAHRASRAGPRARADAPVPGRRRTALPVLAALSALAFGALGACGGDDKVTMPPLTPEPGDSRLADSRGDGGAGGAGAASAKASLPARLVLYRFLRGVAAGDARVCAHLAPAYQRSVFGAPAGCRAGLGPARAKLRPKDIAALRGVTVPAAEDGPGAGAYTVRFEDLKWRGEPARPGGLLAARYTLRRSGARWLISA